MNARYEIVYYPGLGADLFCIHGADETRSKINTRLIELPAAIGYVQDGLTSRGLKFERTDRRDEGCLIISSQTVTI